MATEGGDGRERPRRLGRWVSRVLLLGVFVVGIVGLMYFLAGGFEPKVDPSGPTLAARATPPASPTETLEVRRVKLPRRESAVGTIRAAHEAVVASKLLARVEEVRVKAGQEVARGEVLVVLDKADLRSRIEQARAAEVAAKARAEQAEIEMGRARRLRARDSVTQSEFDQAGTALRTARAELERAQRAVEESRIIESHATIQAPITGRVIDKKVNAGDTVIPGQALLTMYDPTRMLLVASVRESLALSLKVGQTIPARLESYQYECQATVSEIVPEAQARSRSFLVKVTGPCPPNVYSGMFARIFIPLEDEEVLVVSPRAIRRVGQLDEVDVVSASGRSRRVVQLGRVLEEGREVLSGLRAGEKVVPNPVDGPEDGSDRA